MRMVFMKTIILHPIRRSDPGIAAGEREITVRIAGLETTLFLLNRAAVAAGYEVHRATEGCGPHYSAMTVLHGRSFRETALFMLDVAEIVRGTWWAIRDRAGYTETKLDLDVIEKLEAALADCYRFELRT